MQALDLMQMQHKSCVVVVEDDKPVGIITERDVVRFYSGDKSYEDISLGEVMVSPVISISSESTTNQAAEMMLACKVRHLVVVDAAGHMAGLLSEHELTQTMALGAAGERGGVEESFLRTLINTVPDLIWLKNVDGVYLACNARFQRFFGAPEKDIVGRTDYDFMDGDLAESFRSYDKKAMGNGGPSVNEEWVTYADDGHRELLETIKTPMQNAVGKTIGVLGVARDITVRKHTEDALRFIAQRGGGDNAENILTALVQYLGTALGVDYVFIDTLTESGDCAETVAFYSKGDLVPNIRYALKNTPCDNVVGKVLCCYREDVQASFPDDPVLADLGVESYAGMPLWDTAGQPIGLIAAMDGKPFADEALVKHLLQLVSPRVAAELERARSDHLLRMREREFRTLAENAPENIVRYDRDCRVLYANPRMLQTLNVTAEQLMGKTPCAFPEGDEAYEATIRRVIARGEEARIEVTFPDDGNGLRYHSIHIVPERNEAGEVTGALAMGSDISERKRAEAVLAASERRYRNLVENSPFCIHEIDLQGALQSMNSAGLCMLNLDSEEKIRGVPYLSAVSDQDLSGIEALMKDAFDGKASHFEFMSSGEEPLFFKSCFIPIRDGDGNVQKLMGITEDVSERKRMEQQLAEQESLFHTIFSEAPSAVELIDPATLRFVEVNPAACNMLGYTHEEYLSLSLPDTQADMDESALRAAVADIERSGSAGFENRHRSKNGDVLDVEINVRMLDLPGRRLMVAVWRDVTERKCADIALRESEAKFRALFETAGDGIFIQDETGFVDCNEKGARMYGLSREELIGQSPAALAPERQPGGRLSAEVAGEMIAAALNGLPGQFEWQALRADGSPLDVEVNLSRIELKGRVYLQAVVRDISERKQAERQRAEYMSLLNATLESSADAILVVAPDNRWSLYNQRFIDLWRIPPEIVSSGDDNAALCHVVDRLEDPEAFLGKVQELYATPEASSFDTFRFKDGSVIERYSIPQRIAGEVVGRVWSFREVTERKQAELKLQQSEAHFRFIAETAQALIWMSGPDKLYTWFNKVWLDFTGRTMEQEIGGGWLEGVHPDDRQSCSESYASYFDRRESFSIEYRLRHRDGEYRWVLDKGAPRFDAQGVFEGYIGSCFDITERRRHEENLGITASVFDTTQEAILITDADNLITDVNPAFSRITGYRREEVIGLNPKLLGSGRHGSDFYASMWQSIVQNKSWRGEIWNRRKNGEIYAELLSVSAICGDDGRVLRYVGVFSDISRIKEHEEELSRIAHYDALTGIPNRVLLADRMKQGIAQTVREQGMMAVCYLDLDGFKLVNDTLGHEAGDMVLIEMARRIGSTIRGVDTIARLGGDEFVVLLLGLENGGECMVTLDRLLGSIALPLDIAGRQVVMGASIGVTIYPLDDEDPDTLLRHADQAMYVAKQSGKNRYHIYDPAFDLRTRNHYEFINSIRYGLALDQFELYYQPKVDLLTKKLVGAEALVRWRHPERGLLPPGEFLRPVENTDLDIEIGDWVIASALAQIDVWRQAGLDIEVSINISAYHLESPRFSEKLQQQLAHYPELPSGRLQIEVLETVALNDLVIVREIIEACRMFGVRFALDDFGTGYSSLSYLSSLPVDVLKIDQSFVRDMLEDKGDKAIVQGVIALARAFGQQTVAEGIETSAHYQALLEMGCEVGQGYGIARPMTAEMLKSWSAE
ncbi:MAG TPA: PAS domain S-box protein [Gallionella sp.]|nr:PAS domain S-box protein [Gallionella sp.]